MLATLPYRRPATRRDPARPRSCPRTRGIGRARWRSSCDGPRSRRSSAPDRPSRSRRGRARFLARSATASSWRLLLPEGSVWDCRIRSRFRASHRARVTLVFCLDSPTGSRGLMPGRPGVRAPRPRSGHRLCPAAARQKWAARQALCTSTGRGHARGSPPAQPTGWTADHGPTRGHRARAHTRAQGSSCPSAISRSGGGVMHAGVLVLSPGARETAGSRSRAPANGRPRGTDQGVTGAMSRATRDPRCQRRSGATTHRGRSSEHT